MTTEELRLLIEHATEAGLGRAWVIRGVKKPARITPEPKRKNWYYHLTGQIESQRPPGGLLILMYFQTGDGGEPGIEEV